MQNSYDVIISIRIIMGIMYIPVHVSYTCLEILYY